MQRFLKMNNNNNLCFFFIVFLSPLNLVLAVAVAGEGAERDNSFTPKASLIRYWNKEISNNLPKSWFLLNKASPLNSVDSAVFTKLAVNNDLSSDLYSFCSKSNLLCFPDFEQSLDHKQEDFSSGMIEPGRFFKEDMLKTGTVIPMPDIKDKMRKRSFLPRLIISNLPFSTSKLSEMKKIFHAGDGSTMETMMTSALSECEKPASKGENKRCVGSAEDMIDFVISVLGRNVVVRTTENINGSKKDVMVGSVKGINGGNVTKSVSCHQSLFPYLLYYCHSVPKVRVYEADLLDPNTKVKINHGVAICHLDTSNWNATHGAFIALGSSPGKTEVCHWIFENDMSWATAADH